MTEINTFRFAAVLTTDTNFQIGAGLPAELDAHRHQLAYPFSLQGLERVLGQDALLDIFQQELGFRIIAGLTKGHLGQVVGAIGEELGNSGYLVGREGRSGDLDHGAKLVVDLATLFHHHLLGDIFQRGLDDL